MHKAKDWKSSPKLFTLDQVRQTVLQFLICNGILVIFGAIELGIIFSLKESKAERFLYVIDDVSENCNYLIKGAGIFSIILGLLAFLTHILGYPGRLLCSVSAVGSLSHLLICPFAAICIGVGEAASGSISNAAMHKRVIEMDKHYYQHRDSFNLYPISKDRTLITEFQMTFSCCGMFSTKDWYLSNCHCMPISCCKKKQLATCKPLFLGDNNSLKKLAGSGQEFEKFHPYIWKTDCLTEIRNATASLKRKWFIIIGVAATIHFLLATWYFHISTIIMHLSLTPVGHVQLLIFRGHWPSKSLKVKPEYRKFVRVDEELPAEDKPSSHTIIPDEEVQKRRPPAMKINMVNVTNSVGINSDASEVKVHFVREGGAAKS